MRKVLLSTAAVMGVALSAGPAGAVINFPAPGSNSFIALYETDSGRNLCQSQCAIVSSPTQSVTFAPTTFSGPNNSISAGGSVTPTAMRGFVVSSTDAVQFDLAMRDTYTVIGGGFDPFPVTARMHVEGVIEPIFFSNVNTFVAIAGVNARIGEFRIDPVADLVPSVAGFGVPGASAASPFVNRFERADFSVPFAFEVFYTQMVREGDVFQLAYDVTVGFSRGDVDFMNTAAISFDTPHGVFLNAVSGAQFGDVPLAAVPEPATWALMIGGLGFAGAMLRTRRRVALS